MQRISWGRSCRVVRGSCSAVGCRTTWCSRSSCSWCARRSMPIRRFIMVIIRGVVGLFFPLLCSWAVLLFSVFGVSILTCSRKIIHVQRVVEVLRVDPLTTNLVHLRGLLEDDPQGTPGPHCGQGGGMNECRPCVLQSVQHVDRHNPLPVGIIRLSRHVRG